jgi:paraquat-inducible protein A
MECDQVVNQHTPIISEDWVACPSCDHLFDLSSLADGDKSRCSRCNHFLSTYKSDAFSRVQAYASSGLIFLVLASTFPFLSFKSSGLESVMTLPQTIESLYNEGMWDLALLVAGFIVLIPALVLVLLLFLSTALAKGWRYYWPTDVCKLIFHLQSWSMVEVFFIGVLVSLVKISAMATVIIGISFWAYAGFSICFTLALSNFDSFQSWKRIEELQP